MRLRREDGADFSHTYKAGQGDGVYQPTSDRPMADPSAAKMWPFCLESYAALRPPPPAALNSAQMRRDLEEVALLGKDDSKVRTPEQTEIGRFHGLPGIYSWSSVARQAVEHARLGEVESARAMALVEEAIIDSHYAAWDAKYTYNLWRPVTAIAAGRRTAADDAAAGLEAAAADADDPGISVCALHAGGGRANDARGAVWKRGV